MGDVVEAVNGSEPAHIETVVLVPVKPTDVTLRRVGEAEPRTVRLTPSVTPFNQPATVRSLAGGLAYIDLPGVVGGGGTLTTAHEADRTGRVYEGRIPPDQDVGIDWTRIGSEDDPVLRAAIAWLDDQPQCAAAGPE